ILVALIYWVICTLYAIIQDWWEKRLLY
ncbi:amino acid ABC transporter permease, partial [Streptococcus agalactiae]|nr:amino acid ABC transporter permease [Streptococcus agalactiae]